MFKLGLCQMKGSFNKKESMQKAEKFIREAAGNGAEIISLPEICGEGKRGDRGIPFEYCLGFGNISNRRVYTGD